MFFPNDDKLAAEAKKIIEDVVAAEGRCRIVGWRDVPIDGSIVGRMAKRTQPRFVQASPFDPTASRWAKTDCTAAQLWADS